MIQHLNKYIAPFCCFLGIFLMPTEALAQGYISLSGITGLAPATPDFEGFVETIMRMAIIAAALIAVIKLILAGAQYVLSGIVTKKEQAKKDIQSALIGLLIILISVVILRTINPKLANLPALERAPDLGIIVPNVSVGGAPAIIHESINISESTQEEIEAYQIECSNQNHAYTQIQLGTGEIIGRCDTTNTVEQVTTTNPEVAERHRQQCNSNDQLYTETTLDTGETQITCSSTCQNGIVPGENRCSDTPINPGGNVTYQCDTTASDYQNCRNHCASSGGSIDTNGLCTRANDNYFEEG